jgi:tetratricopeptide (TPR) repeat protein
VTAPPIRCVKQASAAAAILPPFGPKGLTTLQGYGKRVILARKSGTGGFSLFADFKSANGDIVTHTLLLRHAAIAGAAIVFGLHSALATETPSTQDLVHATASGSYLAARHAGTERDSATAAAYYLNVLKADPRNADLLSRAFLSVLTDGDIDEAGRLADRVVQVDRNDRIARLVIGVRALKQKQYALARQNFAQSVRGPVTDLAATLLSAWSLGGAGDTHAAVDTLDRLTGPDWYAIFKDLHAGLIFDVANNKKDAGKRYERAYKADAVAVRTVEAYGRYLSRTGAKDEALKIYGEFEKAVPNHPVIMEEAKEVGAGEKLPVLADSPQAGGAEALYGLGSSIGRRGGEDLALIYLQLALYLEPAHQMALLSLADLYEALKKPDLAIKVYDRIPPSSPLHRNAEIQIASDLDALERTDDAKKRLEKLVAEHPKDNEAILALANILRGRKEFAECGDVYSKAVANIPTPEKANWVIFYFRGICYERSKQWPLAEADLKKALQLYPDQPLVLNYLGYSWIDQGVNLDEGMNMIRRAVEQRPDDGYIVDSLGWANFRIGNYDEAVKDLERAVELKPDDSTINDHLGDAYWRVGRVLEARFQWAHAKDLKPEPEDLPKIEAKLKSGLPDDTSSAADAAKKKVGNGG